ncbi:hypothetical protein G9A89_001393 [Geosiphon pyriformis]|nr:hypothetical protein G9A89_001393 [Geosiphon pyriformis]
MNHHGLFPYISCVQELCIDRLTCWVDLVFPKRQRMGAKAEILCYLVLKEFVRHSRRVYSITIPLHPVTKLARKYWFDIMKMLEKHQQINKVNFWGFRMHEDPAQLEDQFQFRHHVFHLIRSQRKLSNFCKNIPWSKKSYHD